LDAALITGKTKPEQIMRSRCAAGHKAMWSEEWGGLPEEEFLVKISPVLKGFRNRCIDIHIPVISWLETLRRNGPKN